MWLFVLYDPYTWWWNCVIFLGSEIPSPLPRHSKLSNSKSILSLFAFNHQWLFMRNCTNFNSEGRKLGWHEVPIHDPNVKDAAKFYMKSLNTKANCLCRYELLDIVRAKIKVSNYISQILLIGTPLSLSFVTSLPCNRPVSTPFNLYLLLFLVWHISA
jgi:hypothetical protein